MATLTSGLQLINAAPYTAANSASPGVAVACEPQDGIAHMHNTTGTLCILGLVSSPLVSCVLCCAGHLHTANGRNAAAAAAPWI
jgi:hypothetical protein